MPSCASETWSSTKTHTKSRAQASPSTCPPPSSNSCAGRVVSKMQILDHVWEYDWDGEVAIVESYISYLRRKLAVEGASGELIHTKRGVGYILRAEE